MRQPPYELKLDRKNGEQCTFLLREPTERDIPEIVRLQEIVYQNIPNKDIFRHTEEEEFRESIVEDRCFCVIHDSRMIGFTLMVKPRISYRNCGSYFDYDDEKLLECVTMDTSFILPDYRGFGLQDLFFQLRDEAGIELGAVEAFTTISPYNEYSLHNAHLNGFRVVKHLKMYGGFERCILRKDLTK